MHLMWLIGLLFLMVPIAVVVVIVIVIAAGIRSRPAYPPQAPPAGPSAPPGDTALDILARRFAAGEISAEEYQKSKDLLQGGGARGA